MPYRRLPNTDLARIRAMKAALKKGALLPPFKLAYSQPLYVKLKTFLPEFDKAVNEQKKAINTQANKNREYVKAFKKAQMYVSHFIQVLNFAILRGELKENARKFYGLAVDDSKVPPLNTDNELLEIGKNIIKGEKERTIRGGSPILSPKITLVNLHYDKFAEALEHQQKLKETSSKATSYVASLRKKADLVILELWNEIESYFDKREANEKRKLASEYGVVYVFRKSEKEHIKRFMQMSA
jgi:hypothetical protein